MAEAIESQMSTIYRCPTCLGVLEDRDEIDSHYCPKCAINYPKACLSTHGAAGYTAGTVIAKVAICPFCGLETITREKSIGVHCRQVVGKEE